MPSALAPAALTRSNDIEHWHAVRQRRRRALADGCDPPAGDPDIDEAPVGQAAMGRSASRPMTRSFLSLRSGSLAHGPSVVHQPASHLDLKFGFGGIRSFAEASANGSGAPQANHRDG